MNFQDIANKIKEKYPNAMIDSEQSFLTVQSKDWLELASYIKDDEEIKFDLLSCLSSIDGEDLGFYVVYNFYSTSLKHKLEIRVFAKQLIGMKEKLMT